MNAIIVIVIAVVVAAIIAGGFAADKATTRRERARRAAQVAARERAAKEEASLGDAFQMGWEAATSRPVGTESFKLSVWAAGQAATLYVPGQGWPGYYRYEFHPSGGWKLVTRDGCQCYGTGDSYCSCGGTGWIELHPIPPEFGGPAPADTAPAEA